MARSDKLRKRFLTRPRDFSWSEMVRMLKGFGYKEYEGRGSRTFFRGEGLPQIRLHRPHPENTIPMYAMDDVKEVLQSEGLI